MIARGGRAGSSVHSRQVARLQESESMKTSERCMYQAGRDRQQTDKLIHNIVPVRNTSSKVSFETVHNHLKLVTSIT